MKESRKQRIDLFHVNNTSWGKRERLENFKKAIEDTDKEKRLTKCECVVCFYATSRIGGCAMTSAECANCKKDMMFGSTCVDLLCKECAKKLKLCCFCGSDIEYKNRRKIDFYQKQEGKI